MKNSLPFLFFFSLFFFFGCTPKYALIETAKLDALQAQLAQSEQTFAQKLSSSLAQNQVQYDENLKASLKFCIQRQQDNFDYLKNRIEALVKPETVIVTQEVCKETQPKIVQRSIMNLKDKLVVGSVEKVHVYPSDVILDARIDTGAETSSIDARNIEEFERDGKNWVRFTLVDRKTNKPYVIERKVIRTVKILQSSVDDSSERRVVVSLKLSIGDRTQVSEFTLTNREHMSYPILIGRNAIQDMMIVDVSEQYIAPLILKKEEKFKK